MGQGPEAVVDPQTLRVHGISGLRVVDASIMPTIVSANTVAATYCLAEKGADLIKRDCRAT
jgi:choline dehydrogenase-like flavoprotein